MVEACGLAAGLHVRQLNHKPSDLDHGDLLRREESGTRLGRKEARALRCKDCKPSDLLMFKENV